MIAEGLVYLLAPHAIEGLLKALKSLAIPGATTVGCIAAGWWLHFGCFGGFVRGFPPLLQSRLVERL